VYLKSGAGESKDLNGVKSKGKLVGAKSRRFAQSAIKGVKSSSVATNPTMISDISRKLGDAKRNRQSSLHRASGHSSSSTALKSNDHMTWITGSAQPVVLKPVHKPQPKSILYEASPKRRRMPQNIEHNFYPEHHVQKHQSL